jgi:hypothetical protein
MTTNRQFSLALQALAELKTETSTPPSLGKPRFATPTLSEVLATIGSLPREALFLGMASDGLPVLLNLYDPHPGAVLIVGDAGSGKTAFLQTIARSVTQTHGANEVQFGVITDHPEEWESVDETSHRAGIFPVQQDGAQDFVLSLASWAHAKKNTHQCMLLLIDDLESVASLEVEALQNLRWLLLRGPSRRVWPIITLSAPRYGQVIAWLQNFRTRIFGCVANEHVAEALGGDKASALDQLEAPIQFTLREKENWLRFWLPSC